MAFKYVPISLFILTSSFLSAQNDSLEITTAIYTLFTGMQVGDSALVHSVFFDEAVLHTTYINKKGESNLKTGSLERFLESVGTPHDEAWNETINTLSMKIDGSLAHVWTDYSFFLGEKLIHCGINSFHLIKNEDKWRIIHLIDTRRRQNCE